MNKYIKVDSVKKDGCTKMNVENTENVFSFPGSSFHVQAEAFQPRCDTCEALKENIK